MVDFNSNHMDVSSAFPRGGNKVAVESAVRNDIRVRKIEDQIQSWKCCPTTDARTKAEKVNTLEVQLVAIKSGIESQLKSTLDIRA